MLRVQGQCTDQFSKVRDLLQANLDSGEVLGASLAVEVDGELVVDLWGGYTDDPRATKWQRDTVVNLWSTTKSISSLAMLTAVDRGLLNVDERVSKYWLDFAANGKERVRVRQRMSHTSGVPAWEKTIEVERIYDVEKSAALLARQTPWWSRAVQQDIIP